jgi:hypothetical protein
MVAVAVVVVVVLLLLLLGLLTAEGPVFLDSSWLVLKPLAALLTSVQQLSPLQGPSGSYKDR